MLLEWWSDYAVMRVVWWALLGVLWMGFAVLEGFDLGALMLLTPIARSDAERRVVINTLGPVWESNQVWLILAGGAVFAAWPLVYAASFSALYPAMAAVLIGIVLRPGGFKYRSKLEDVRWRATWDGLLSLSGFLAALILGIAAARVMEGVGFRFLEDYSMEHRGGFFDLLTPWGLFGGAVSVVLSLRHGSAYLVVKTEGVLRRRAERWFGWTSVAALGLLLVGWWWLQHRAGCVVVSGVTSGPSDPFAKHAVCGVAGAWMHGPLSALGRGLGLASCGLLVVSLLPWIYRFGWIVWLSSALTMVSLVASWGCLLFPFLLPSSWEPSHGLTVWDSSSSLLTLQIMLLSAIIFLPIILCYVSFLYRVFRHPVTEAEVTRRSDQWY
jgi:cytochrome d ubiquinol oxidase subunit II